MPVQIQPPQSLIPPVQPGRGTNARVYTATHSQAEASPSAVTGQLFFHSVSLYALIDSGATHSFIAPGVIERVGLVPVRSTHSIRIEMPDGGSVITDKMLKD